VAFACAGVVIAAFTASAQTLDLDGPAAPFLGDASALRVRAVALRDERELAGASITPTTPDCVAIGLRLRAAARSLAAALLDLNEQESAIGPVGALGGLRIADAMADIDAIASSIAEIAAKGSAALRTESPDVDAIAAWERARAGADAITRRCEALAVRITQSPESFESVSMLDAALAHAISELRVVVDGGEEIEPAWIRAGSTGERRSVEEAALALDMDAIAEPVRTCVTRVFAALRAGESAPEVRRDRRAAAWRVVDALRAMDVLRGAGVNPTVVDGFCSACEAMHDPSRREYGLARIDTIARLGALTENAVALEAEDVNIAGLREALGVLATGLASPAGENASGDGETVRVLQFIARMGDDARRAPRRAALDFRDGRFNRAWRALVKRHEGVEQAAFELGARAARAPSILGSPEAVSAAAALTDSTDTLIRIASLGEWIGELRSSAGSGSGGAVRAGAADRLTVIRKGIGYDDHRDGALFELARWERMRPMIEAMPGEGLLRANDPRIGPVTRSRAAAVVRVMEVAKSEWVGAWARADETAGIAAETRIELLGRLGSAIEDAASLRDPGAPARISAWGALRVTPGAHEAIRDRCEAVLGDAVSAAIDAQGERLAELLSEWDRSCVGARMVARIGRLSKARPYWPEPHEGAAIVVATLAAGPPSDAWVGDRRAELAAISVWMAELEGAVARGDTGLADAIGVWVNHLADPVLEELTRRDRREN